MELSRSVLHRILAVVGVIGTVYFLTGVLENPKNEIEHIGNKPRVVNGTPVEENKGFPKSVVLLLIKRKSGSKTKTSRCTGNILDSTTIITAAHCFDNSWLRVDVYAGAYSFGDFTLDQTQRNQQFYLEYNYDSYNLDQTFRNHSSTKLISQQGVYVHPTWDGDVNKGYDVAVIKLANGDKVRFNKHLKPVKLEARTVPEFARYYMLGFGRLNRDMKETSMALRFTQLVNRHTDVCLDLMQKFPKDFPTDNVKTFRFVNNSICAVRYNSPNHFAGQPCNGDSGGSIFTVDRVGDYAIAGTLSWGTPQACTLFTVFERAQFNRAWIDKFGDFFNY